MVSLTKKTQTKLIESSIKSSPRVQYQSFGRRKNVFSAKIQPVNRQLGLGQRKYQFEASKVRKIMIFEL